MEATTEITKASVDYALSLPKHYDNIMLVSHRKGFEAGAIWAKTNWIEVDDRMPDHNGVVLCCNVNDADTPICLGTQVSDGETIFYLHELDDTSDKVTHWMELPEKPCAGLV
jgi:hypothetical protein